MPLQPVEGAGQSFAVVHACVQCAPRFGKLKHSFGGAQSPGIPTIMHADANGSPPAQLHAPKAPLVHVCMPVPPPEHVQL
jgi:hypothetical protein